MSRNFGLEPRNWQQIYRRLGIDPENPNPDGSDYHLMNHLDDRGIYHPALSESEKEFLHKIAANRAGKATPRDIMIVAVTALVCGILAICFWVASARADNISVGVWDAALNNGVVTPLGASTGNIQMLNTLLPSGQAGGNINALTFVNSDGSVFRELAVDDFFNDFTTGDTVRFYASFQGIVGSGQITMPTYQQAFQWLPGWQIITQTFVCGTLTFCDNYITGGGSLVSGAGFFSGTGLDFGTFSATVGSPYTITEMLQFTNFNGAPNGDVGAAILTQPDVAVPGPIAGAGLPGLVAGIFALMALARRRWAS